MKTKNILTIAAIALGTAGICIMPVIAEPDGSPCSQRCQGQERKIDKKCNPMDRLTKKLDLTEDQQKQIQPIVDAFTSKCKKDTESNKAKRDAIFTDAQKKQLEENRDKGHKDRQKIQLSDKQKEQFKALSQENMKNRKAAKEQFKAQIKPFLTPSQITKFEKMSSEEVTKGHMRGRGPGNCKDSDKDRHSNRRRVMHPGPVVSHPYVMLEQRLTKELNLTEDQQKQIQPIITKHNADRKARMEELRKNEENADNKLKADIKAILTPEQAKKLDDVMVKRPPLLPNPRMERKNCDRQDKMDRKDGKCGKAQCQSN